MSESFEGNYPEKATIENVPEATYKPVAIKCTFEWSALPVQNENHIDPPLDHQFEESVAVDCTLYSPPQ